MNTTYDPKLTAHDRLQFESGTRPVLNRLLDAIADHGIALDMRGLRVSAEEAPAAPVEVSAEEANDAAAIASLEALVARGADAADTVVVRRGTASTRQVARSFLGQRDSFGRLVNAEVAFEYADLRYGQNPKLDAARNAVLDLAELAY